mmetsp:Transcript_15034/g.20614  ORF Transcript_15034/g.20614 Transcript_15034/m.20614 type:complete len:415 (+) Transcript_15034:310-1554(+)
MYHIVATDDDLDGDEIGTGEYPDPYDSDPYHESDPYGYGSDNAAAEQSSTRKLHSTLDIDEFLKESDQQAAVIGYFDESTNSKDLGLFTELAEEEGNNLKFAYTTSKEVLEEKKYDGFSVVVHLPSKFVSAKYDRPKHRYPSKTITGLQQLKDFVLNKALPLVGEMTIANKQLYDSKKTPYLTVFTAVDLEKNFKQFNYIANRVRKVAKDFKNKLNFNIASKSKFNYILESDYVFNDHTMKDTVVGIRAGNFFYRMDANIKFSPESLLEFVNAYLAGKIEGVEKKTPAAPKGDEDEDDSDSAVVTLTNDNFKSEVTEPKDKDVLVEFYAPWCGHCKQLKPEFKATAEHFKDDSGVTIAAMDATANTVPKGFDVSGYPTLYFVPADTKKPKLYDGGRDMSSFIAYIKSHRTTSPP